MRAIILSVGDELVSGLTVDTNSAWLSGQLSAMGIATLAHATVSDTLEAVREAIVQTAPRCDVLLITGGLGPTEDDLTRNALAEALGDDLVEDAEARRQIEAFFKARHRPFTGSNLVQALRPKSAECISNACGTAPGLAATLRNGGHATRVFVFPGVPREMVEMFTTQVRPLLQAQTGGRVTLLNKINTFGLGESALGERIRELMLRGAFVEGSVGTTVADGVVSVRIYASGTPEVAAAFTDRIRGIVRERLGAFAFGENDATLAQAVGALLKERKQSLATAESCTGGLVAQLVTDVPGSSEYFMRGYVTYSNAAKTADLGVPAELIAQHGAVSEAVAKAMAAGARSRAGTDYAISLTGIAGPDGGSCEKPVGTVWIGLATPKGTTAFRNAFPGTRTQVRLRAALMALAILRWTILGMDPEALLSTPGVFGYVPTRKA